MINLDPALLDQDAIRLKRRKRLLLIAILPTIVLVSVAAIFIRTTIYNTMLATNSSSALYPNLTTMNDFQKVGNIIEPYIVYYNGGTIKLVEAKTTEDLASAEEDFKESLKQNPPEEALCLIYGNYSYAVEVGADYMAKNKDYNGSLVEYNRAKALLYENGCANKSNPGSGSDQKSEDAVRRIDSKYRKAVASANEMENPEEGGEGESGEGKQISEEQMEEWEKEQSEATEEAIKRLIRDKSYKYGRENSIDYFNPVPGY